MATSNATGWRGWSLLGMSIVSWTFAMLSRTLWASSFRSLSDALAQLGEPLLPMTIAIATTVALMPAIRGRRAAFLTGGHIWNHPPLWLAVLLALLIHVGAVASGLADTYSVSSTTEIRDLTLLMTCVVAGVLIAM